MKILATMVWCLGIPLFLNSGYIEVKKGLMDANAILLMMINILLVGILWKGTGSSDGNTSLHL